MLNGLNNFSIPKVSSVILVVYVSIEEYKTININLNISYYNYHRIKGNNSINNLFDYFINNYIKTILNEDYNYVSFGIYNDGSYNYLVLLY